MKEREEGWEGGREMRKKSGWESASGERWRDGIRRRLGKRKEGTEIDSHTYKEAEADKATLWETDQPPKQKTEEKAAKEAE